ncbi:atrial natriuretic peptide receptor 3-like [Tubulanus polymorphus]|uniref:atrial natriuretic peptide receptor 3-like n=1 Tax=Tubulanus polymorphus TaxID=672921 RepID=UPI003DA2A1E9
MELIKSVTKRPLVTFSRSATVLLLLAHCWGFIGDVSGGGLQTAADIVWRTLTERTVVPGKQVNISLLVPGDDKWYFSARKVFPAIDIAKRKVKITGGYTLSLKWGDTNCSDGDGMNQAIQFYLRKEVNVFLGPVCDYTAAPVARQMRYWNMPMISPGCFADDFGTRKKIMYPLLTRINPANARDFADIIQSIFRAYGWHRIRTLYDNLGQSHVIQEFCHLFMGSLNDVILQSNNNITLDHKRFRHQDINQKFLKDVVGNEYSSWMFNG